MTLGPMLPIFDILIRNAKLLPLLRTYKTPAASSMGRFTDIFAHLFLLANIKEAGAKVRKNISFL